MSYEITRQHIEASWVLYQEARCEHGQIADALARILPAVYRHATTQGIATTGPPFASYQNWELPLITLHAGLPVQPGAAGSDQVQVAMWEATTAAVTLHTGPYDTLTLAHAAVERYLAQLGLNPGRAPFEIYLTDPAEVADPAQWQTQVIWPIAK